MIQQQKQCKRGTSVGKVILKVKRPKRGLCEIFFVFFLQNKYKTIEYSVDDKAIDDHKKGSGPVVQLVRTRRS